MHLVKFLLDVNIEQLESLDQMHGTPVKSPKYP